MLPQILVFSPLAGMSKWHSGPRLLCDLRHRGTQSTVGTGCVLAFPFCRFVCLCVWTIHFPISPLTLPPPRPLYHFFSSRDGGLSAYTAICAAVLPCVAGFKFHIPAGNPTPVSITTAPSVCVVGSWVALRQSSCHTPFVIVALLLLNHSSSSYNVSDCALALYNRLKEEFSCAGTRHCSGHN